MHRNFCIKIYNIKLSFIILINTHHRLIAKTGLFGPKGLTGNLRPGRPEIGLRVSCG